MGNKHIVLVTSGQPSLNPRLIKEADTLHTAGYTVTVVYQHRHEWADLLDQQLLSKKGWQAIGIGNTRSKRVYYISRIKHRLARLLYPWFKNVDVIRDTAIGRCTYSLANTAKSLRADLYIAHNLAALPAAQKAAAMHTAKLGFDAEDFHRHEQSQDAANQQVMLSKAIEDHYFNYLDYLTTSSPLISEAYERLYPDLTPYTILNVLDEPALPEPNKTVGGRLKLIWFSQVVGQNRGIETVMKAIGLCKGIEIELTLLGQYSPAIKDHFLSIARSSFSDTHFVRFHEPITPDKITAYCAQFDIGLASEPGFSPNNDMALSNKLFTYLHCGLAILASDTNAQKLFMQTIPNTGMVYPKTDAEALAECLKKYSAQQEILLYHQQNAYLASIQQFNWAYEGKKFLSLIESILAT